MVFSSSGILSEWHSVLVAICLEAFSPVAFCPDTILWVISSCAVLRICRPRWWSDSERGLKAKFHYTDFPETSPRQTSATCLRVVSGKLTFDLYLQHMTNIADVSGKTVLWNLALTQRFRIMYYTMCQKNETRVILNILYSCKSTAMKCSVWYPDGLSY